MSEHIDIGAIETAAKEEHFLPSVLSLIERLVYLAAHNLESHEVEHEIHHLTDSLAIILSLERKELQFYHKGERVYLLTFLTIEDCQRLLEDFEKGSRDLRKLNIVKTLRDKKALADHEHQRFAFMRQESGK